MRWLLLFFTFIIGYAAAFAQDQPQALTLDTTWQGEVTLKGVVVVKKGATLTIRPGSKISFPKIDLNGDGIGEGELIIEGSLVAKGTKERPIIFTSAENNPQRRDWKFIMVNFSAGAQLEYCVIEYAFSAVQVHFSPAIIKNCVFRRCEDGMRFSTAKITVRHNQITDNIYGLRYEERGSSALIQFNEITRNDYGLFCVLKSENRSQINQNNIYDNRKYNVLLGVNQLQNISLPDNYWGVADPEAALQKIFARHYEPSLGAVDIQPLRRNPVPAAGVE